MKKKSALVTVMIFASLLFSLGVIGCSSGNQEEAGETPENTANEPVADTKEYIGYYQWKADGVKVYDIKIRFLQNKNASVEQDPETGLVWNGLLYEMEGSSPYFEKMIEQTSTTGKIWTDSFLEYMNPREGHPSKTGVQIHREKGDTDTFYITLGNTDYFIRFTPNDPEASIDFEEAWRMEHENSEDPIDQAILLSVKLSQENPDDPLLSAVTPQRSEAILTAMRTIPIESFPEVWERCCTEVAYRAQKLTAMEQFLQISLEYGLYDPWAQEQWYLRFTEMKASLPAEEVTEEDRLRYGNLLLPLLEERLKGGSLGESEWTVLQAMIGQASGQFDFPEKSVATRKEALDWFSAHENLTEAIRRIIEKDYSWIP